MEVFKMTTTDQEISQEEFDQILIEDVLYKVQAFEIISIPGIYEILAEHYNNEIIEIWEDSK